jgi:hypothetical protein
MRSLLFISASNKFFSKFILDSIAYSDMVCLRFKILEFRTAISLLRAATLADEPACLTSLKDKAKAFAKLLSSPKGVN